MEFVRKLYELLRHLNDRTAWDGLIGYVGHGNIYLVLFLIIFAETGLVILPFLPGDSLLFAIGAITAKGVGLHLPTVIILLIVAAVVGDAVNYWIGYKFGPAIFRREEADEALPGDGASGRKRPLIDKLMNKKHLQQAQEFYDKYGGKTIILARFVPIVRTFAPFVAGIGKMNYFRFLIFNLIGGVAWVLLCVLAGSLLGGMAFVQKHFELVLIAVVLISVLPMVVEYLRARKEPRGFATSVNPSAKSH